MNSPREKFSWLIFPISWALRMSAITLGTTIILLIDKEPAVALAANLAFGLIVVLALLIWGLFRIWNAYRGKHAA